MDRPYRDLARTLASGTAVGGYVIEERIGVGGFGEVYSARQPTIDRIVAIKILHARFSSDAGAIARFVDEARAVNQIAHPGIVEVYDFGTHEGRAYMVMELIDGELLRGVLDVRERLPLADALPILRGIAEAIDAAHARGIAHRDLKPDNVFVCRDGRTKLIDFGLAKLTLEDANLTETGAIFGTPHYMSPEQCRGRGVGTRTDQYAFGALIYRMLTGAPPFTGDPIELALHHVNDKPEPPSARCGDVSRAVDRVVLALLAKDPAERPASLGDAVSALAGEARLRVKRSRNARHAMLAAGVLALAGAAAVVVEVRGSKERPAVAGSGSMAPVCDEKAIDDVWNPTIVDELAQKFAAVGTSRATTLWKETSARLATTATGWRTARAAACTTDDRDREPLRYGQRLACLDRVLATTRSEVGFLRATDAHTLVDFQAPTVDLVRLGDCTRDEVLDVQVPQPKEAVRPRVAELQLAVDRTMLAGWRGWTSRDLATIDKAADELGSLANQLAALDPPSASIALLTRVTLLVEAAWDVDPSRLREAEVVAKQAAMEMESTHDDAASSLALVTLVELERLRLPATDPATFARLDADLAHAEAAVRRAGRPIGPRLAADVVHAYVAIAEGKLPDAIAAAQDAVAVGSADFATDDSGERELVAALAFAGRTDDAAAELRRWLARVPDEYTPLLTSADVSLLANDPASALLDVQQATRIAIRADVRDRWGAVYVAEVALQAGEPATAKTDAAIAAIAKQGTVPERGNPDGVETVRRAGMFALFVRGASVVGDDALASADREATLAFMRGDRTRAGAAAARVVAACDTRCRDHVVFGRWIALVTAPPTTDAALAQALHALEHEAGDAPLAQLESGIVYASLGKWERARDELEAARGRGTWSLQADLADLDANLGQALEHLGDVPRATLAYEESLAAVAFTTNGIDGFTYTAPVAQQHLAALLWARAAPGDRVRARFLAQRSVRGFARLGVMNGQVEAQRWLDSHGAL